MLPANPNILWGAPITIGYRKIDDEWHCIALEFNILGIGLGRKAAFTQMCELFDVFIDEVRASAHPVGFGCPADQEDWDSCEKEYHYLMRGPAPPTAVANS